MQVSAQSGQTLAMVQTIQTRPRGLTTSSGRHPVPSTPSSGSGNGPVTDTQSRRAISRSAPAPIGIVVTGDNHLSAALPGYSPERRAERQARLRAGFSATVDYALQHGARLFVIAGDLFDTPTPSNAERAYVAGELARLRRANVICLGATGMSDSPRLPGVPNAAESPYATYAALDSLIYFPATAVLAPHLITVGDLHVAVVGISTNPAAAPGSDPLADVAIADPEGVLSRAHVGLLFVHAGVEGFARAADEERILMRASLQALPPTLRVVVAGHIHRFGRARIGEREIIVPGSTERMDFDSQPGSSGFAWLEVGSEGLARVKRVAVVEQPRADPQLSTAQLFPASGRARRGAVPTVPIQPEAQPAGESPEAGVETASIAFPRWRSLPPAARRAARTGSRVGRPTGMTRRCRRFPRATRRRATSWRRYARRWTPSPRKIRSSGCGWPGRSRASSIIRRRCARFVSMGHDTPSPSSWIRADCASLRAAARRLPHVRASPGHPSSAGR